LKFEQREHKWIQMPACEAAAVIADHKKTNANAEKDLAAHYFTVTDEQSASGLFGYGRRPHNTEAFYL
jgi:hypothetical protein